MAIRYDKRLNNEINSIAKRYNAKIYRLRSKERDYTLPETITKDVLKSLKASVNTRKDLRRRLKDYESFLERGAERNVEGSNIPVYLSNNIKRYKRLLKYQTTLKMHELETRHPVTNNKVDPFTFSQYGTEEYLTTRAKRDILLTKDVSTMNRRQATEYLNKLIRNTRSKRLDMWQDNYLGMLEDAALSFGYNTDKLEVIVNRLKALDPKKFDDLAFINRNIKEIVFYYKTLADIATANDLAAVGEDVIRNLDSIYDNLDDILSEYE